MARVQPESASHRLHTAKIRRKTTGLYQTNTNSQITLYEIMCNLYYNFYEAMNGYSKAKRVEPILYLKL